MNSTDQIQDIKVTLNRPVVLVGMMGAGKSHIGRMLAKALDWPFYDSDSVVEEKAGCPVAEVFEKFGEAKFRESERQTILDIMDSGLCVLATGGGAVTNADVLREITQNAHVIWLQAGIEGILQRVGNREDRPLLRGDAPQEKLRALMDARQHLYAQAHIHVETVDDSPDATFDKVVKSLSEHVKSSRV